MHRHLLFKLVLLIFFSALSLSYIFNWEPIMLQIYVSELNYVLDQNKPQNDADSTSPPSMPSVTRKFCPFTRTILQL